MGTSTKRLPTKSLSELFTAQLSQGEMKEVKENMRTFQTGESCTLKAGNPKGLTRRCGNLFPFHPLNLLSA